MRNKTLFILSLTIFIYFLALFLNAYVIKFENILLGMFQETLTIPMLIFQVVLLVIAFKRSVKDKFVIKNLAFWSFALMFVSTFVTLGSLIFQ